MDSVVILPRDRVQDTISAMRRLIVDGARTPAVRDHLALAAAAFKQAGQHQPAAADVLRSAYEALRARFVFLDDPYGEELVQRADVSLERLAGDCDDGTVLVLTLAHGLGLAGRLVVLSAGAGDERTALHVYGEAETAPGEWTALDLGEGLPYGAAPAIPEATWFDVYDVAPPSGPGLGFLDAIVSAVSGIFGAKAARDAAREERRGTEATAAALRQQSADQLTAAREQAEAAENVAAIQALQAVGTARATGAAVNRVLGFARDVMPALLVLAAARTVVPLLAPPARRRAG